MTYTKITLKKGRERAVIGGSPWIFSGSVKTIGDAAEPGQPCYVFTADGSFLGTGYVNPYSSIPCRMLSRQKVIVDGTLIHDRIASAMALRKRVISPDTTGYRVVNSEGDFLPGLIIDRYGECIVVQFLTQGMEHFRDDVLTEIDRLLTPTSIVERSDTTHRREENLPTVCGVISGNYSGPVEILEHGMRLLVNPLDGQKTGFYLDQRDARHVVRALCGGKSVLNLFSYTGGFSVAAAYGGATSVTSVDTSAPALELACSNMALNGFDPLPTEYVREDVFSYLNHAQNTWDVIVLDPPAFANRKAVVDTAARGYKELNLKALKLVSPGGILATFSCSHHINTDLFGKIVFGAATDAGRNVQIIGKTGHPADHPVNIGHREGEYLKGTILRVAS